MAAEIRHQTGRQVDRRVEFGEVLDSEGHRVMLAHDQDAGTASIHGVSFELDQIDRDLRASFNLASSAFVDAATDAEEQSNAKALLSVVVQAILRRHSFIGDAVKRQQHHQRFAAV
jgi:hypothetical protein